jgi:acetamidase/formamidase
MEHDVELGGVRTWYGEQGAGDPLVLLHPGLVDARAFGSNLAVWSARFHTFTPERRGHGHTPDVEGPLTFEQMAQDTVAFIATVVGRPTRLLGVSDGAIVALLTAVRRPDLVTRLVLIAGPAHHDGWLPEAIDPANEAPEFMHAAYGEVSPDGIDHYRVVLQKMVETHQVEPTLTPADLAKVAREGARTVPARENGGNHDIKNFTRGSRVFYPVHVPGAKLSGGDLHFSQGDGEITFCGAIEMGGFIDFGVDLIKGGMAKYGVSTNPIFLPGRVEPRYSEFISFVGVSVDHDTNTNYYMNATLAYKRACLNAIEYLKTFGYSGEQAYLLLGSAPIEGRISGIVDIPNACCSLYVPTAIFDFDIRPTAEGPRRADRGQCAVTS